MSISGAPSAINVSENATATFHSNLYGWAGGTLNQTGGTVDIKGGLRINEDTGSLGTATVNLSGGTFVADSDADGDWTFVGVYAGQSFLNVSGTADETFGSNLIVGYEAPGTLNQTGGTVNIKGGLRISEITGSSTVNLSGGTFVADSDADGDWTFVGVFGGQGFLNVSGTADVTFGYNLIVGYDAPGILTQTGGTVTVGGDLELALAGSTGTYDLGGGTLDMTGDDINFGAGTAAFNFTGGTLLNVNTFDSSLTQTNTDAQSYLAPGASVGTMNINGDYDLLSGIYQVEIDGLGSNDLVNVTGVATLDGVVQVEFLGGFVPELGETYDVLTAGSQIFLGTEFAVDNSLLPGGGFLHSLVNGDTTLRLEYVPEPSTFALAALGLVGLAFAGRRRRKKTE